uniref:Inhibitor of nuclear factor kappa B kinase subunit epsilon n=1 Tax=Eptatretus burgeri TaxID=7764 RepID=A0A8C4NBW7_EPTBU
MQPSIQSTPSFLWSTADILGQGATGCVYRARHKKTGDLHAVKVFNRASYVRPRDVQTREFEVLQKLNHKNIVKLFAVEDENSSNLKVIVMELCGGGSLYTILDEPENAHGLPESEFLVVLRDVASGMNHLREKGVIHRDLKPGNIMRVMAPDGESVYKLTDFGAARQLGDDEQFVSLYGTEEYLHPDMYERAVLKKPLQKAYGATVDLWSIGVTFYHVATGTLPFRPYEGPRKNKELMFHITTKKPLGAISGVQGEENGPISWGYELPTTCQLSRGLKVLLQPLLANILEVDPQRCWGFDQFFAEANDIVTRRAIDVLSLMQLSLLKVYAHPEQTWETFQDLASQQTGILAAQQSFIYNGRWLLISPNQPVSDIPITRVDNPIILVTADATSVRGLAFVKPVIPRFHPQYSLLQDASLAKNVAAVLFQTLRLTKALLQLQELGRKAAFWFRACLHDDWVKVQTISKEINQRRSDLEVMLNIVKQTFNTVGGNHNDIHSLQNVQADLGQALVGVEAAQEAILEAEKDWLSSSPLLSSWMETVGSKSSDKDVERIRVFVDKVNATCQQFKKEKMKERLPYNEEQIHKFDKQKLGAHAMSAMSRFTDKCVFKYDEFMRQSVIWLGIVKSVYAKVGALGYELSGQAASLEHLQQRLRSWVQDSYPNRMAKLVQPNCGFMALAHGNDGNNRGASPPEPLQTFSVLDIALGMKQLAREVKELSFEIEDRTQLLNEIGEAELLLEDQ